MKLALSTLLISLALIAAAHADEAPALATTGTSTSLGALLDGGYEIVSAQALSPEDQKNLWPNDTVAPYIMFVLQRGPSIASCVLATASVLNVAPSALAVDSGCRAR